MINIGNVIEICQIISDASSRITILTGEHVELRLINPPMPGFEPKHRHLEEIERDLLIHNITDVVTERFNTTLNSIRYRGQTPALTDARKAICLLMKTYVPGISDEKIGKIVNLDRSTVIYNRQEAENLILIDETFRLHYKVILTRLKIKQDSHD